MTPPLVLIVDDDFDVCEVYADALIDVGYAVAIARNGREALTFLDRAPVLPALILVDLMMPVMDGRELVAALKRRPAFDRIPLVVLTANRGVPPIDSVPVLYKPFSLETLHEAVRTHLGGAESLTRLGS